MDQARIVRDYKELRRASVPLNTRLVRMLRPDEIRAAGSALGVLHGKHIDLETEDELSVVIDYAIHSRSADGRNAVDRLLEQDPFPEGSTELRLLRAMQNARFTVFEVTTPIPGLGVSGLDGPEHEPILLVDLGFSQTADPGLALATRIIAPADGWWMTTGAALPFNPQAIDQMIREFDKYERRHGVEPPAQERERIITRACIASGASHDISYAKLSEVARTTRRAGSPAIRNSAKAGRNDPCPCGSGKKFKKCCGS